MSNTTPNLNLFKYDPTVDGENTFNIDTCMNDNWDKLDTAVSNISIESKTYAELKTLKDNNQLKQGKKYLLTDYRTKYQQPTTLVIKEMAIEQLVLTANSTNSFESIVSSPTYPQDIIQYNFNDNKCEDKTTPRTGFIQRRTDTITKNDCPQDWRTMLWARYKPDTMQYYKDGVLSNYSVWTSGNAVMGVVYKSENSLYMAKNTNVPTSPTDSNVFYMVYEDINIGMLIEEKTKIADKIELKKGELHERLTFGDSCYRNYIGEITARGHNNVLGSSCTSINLGLTNYDNTFGNSCTVNYFGDNSFENIISTSCSENSFGNFCYKNTLGVKCASNSFGESCYENILGEGCQNNSFGEYCYKNILACDCDTNSFGNGCGINVFESKSGYNNFGNGCYNNVIGNYCVYNSFGNRCDSNVFGDKCEGNSFDNYCSSIIISNNLRYSHFENGIKNKNLSSIDIYGKFYTTHVVLNVSKDTVMWYLDSTNKPVYTVMP